MNEYRAWILALGLGAVGSVGIIVGIVLMALGK